MAFFFFFSLAASDGISFCSQAANPSFWVKIGQAPRPCEAWFITSPVVAATGDSLRRSGLGWRICVLFNTELVAFSKAHLSAFIEHLLCARKHAQ